MNKNTDPELCQHEWQVIEWCGQCGEMQPPAGVTLPAKPSDFVSASEYATLKAEHDAAVKLAEANAAEVARLTDAMREIWRETSSDSIAESLAAKALGHEQECSELYGGGCDCGGIEPTP